MQSERPAEERPADWLETDEIVERAAGGTALLVGRAVVGLGLGVVANIVLARLLLPHDFGVVALGSVLIVFGGYIAEGGLGAALIRRDESPTRRQLEAVNALQLTVTTALACVFAAVALPFGRDGQVVALMVASVPVVVLRTPSMIVLERMLRYRAIATADLCETAVFYVSAVALVAAGMGVWGMAAAMVIRAVVGTTIMIRLGPIGLLRPRWSWAESRPLVAFGAKVQVLAALGLGRDQGLNVGIALIAGVATLGIWNLAFRVLQIPSLIVTTVGRVAYPAISRLLETGRDVRPAIERGVATMAVGVGCICVAIAGFAPALPAIVGDAWGDVPAALAWSTLAITVYAPVYVTTAGYLYATDQVGTIIRVSIAKTAVWFAVAFPLLPVLGAEAVGLGWIAGAVVSSTLLGAKNRRDTGAAVAQNLLPPVAAAAAAGALGWSIAVGAGETVLGGVLGAATGEFVLIGLLALLRRALLREAYLLLARAVRRGAAPSP